MGLMYVFIRLARMDITKLSYLHTFLNCNLNWMYEFRRLTSIDINIVNLDTIHFLIMLNSSCLSRYAQVNKYGLTTIFATGVVYPKSIVYK